MRSSNNGLLWKVACDGVKDGQCYTGWAFGYDLVGVILVCDGELRWLRRQLGFLGVTSTRFLILLAVDGLAFAREDEFQPVRPVDCMLSSGF